MKMMNKMLLTVCAVAISFVSISRVAHAHHGLAGFDTKTKVTFKGTVREFHFVSPHAVVEFDVKDEKNQVRKWEGQLTSPSHLVPRGWTATSLERGDEITVTGYRALRGARTLWITNLASKNGKALNLDNDNEQ